MIKIIAALSLSLSLWHCLFSVLSKMFGTELFVVYAVTVSCYHAAACYACRA